MRVIFLGSLVICLHCHAAANVEKCPQAYKGLEVRANVSGHVLSRDQPIPVVVTIHNGSTEAVRLQSYMELTYHWLNFEVIGPAGKQIPYRGPSYKSIDDGSRGLTLGPGYSWGRGINDLRDSYDLTKPGRYRLRAIYGVAPGGECVRGSLVSAPVSFEVR